MHVVSSLRCSLELQIRGSIECNPLIDLFVQIPSVLVVVDPVGFLTEWNDRPDRLDLFTGIDDGVLPGDPSTAYMPVKSSSSTLRIEGIGLDELFNFERNLGHFNL